ncbi:hypothetical protein [Leuconostoc lactis]|uniref:hypothetical protein n=1 Tax=Leuconostoc lactis TaxID=1246 RepID=UPI0021C241E1|nr:hypothetical protein [Leuconostoc lactis]MCT8388322.1 hypothetical protein [Leuconostoc lactis]
MQNISRFILKNTEMYPIANVIRSNAEGYYIEDTHTPTHSLISRQELTGIYGINDESLLSLFEEDGTIIEKREDAITIINFLKDNI